MNQSFFQLPIEKQKKLINAGYKLFALYPYKKASMLAIAEEADISKSLLFYYFKNKKEYYLFLFDRAIEFLNEHKVRGNPGRRHDFFKLVNEVVEHRMKMLNDYPYLYKFTARAYYETLEEIKSEIDKKKKIILERGEEDILKLIDYNKFKNPNDVEVLHRIVLALAEGCMRGLEDLNAEKLQKSITEYKIMLKALKKYYYKEEYLFEE